MTKKTGTLTRWIVFSLVISRSFAYAQADSSRVFETGIASYYAKAFEGRKCSSGQCFRHDSLTAAHKSLKFGTRVKVTNLKNDSVVIVTINDRLPRNSKRCIDLTRKGAARLNFIARGLTKVSLELVKDSLTAIIPSEEKKE